MSRLAYEQKVRNWVLLALGGKLQCVLEFGKIRLNGCCFLDRCARVSGNFAGQLGDTRVEVVRELQISISDLVGIRSRGLVKFLQCRLTQVRGSRVEGGWMILVGVDDDLCVVFGDFPERAEDKEWGRNSEDDVSAD